MSASSPPGTVRAECHKRSHPSEILPRRRAGPRSRHGSAQGCVPLVRRMPDPRAHRAVVSSTTDGSRVAGTAWPASRSPHRARAMKVPNPAPLRWRAASIAPRSGCARPAPASPPRRAASPARASHRSAPWAGRCARCPTRRRQSAARRGHPLAAAPCGSARRGFQQAAFRSSLCPCEKRSGEAIPPLPSHQRSGYHRGRSGYRRRHHTE